MLALDANMATTFSQLKRRESLLRREGTPDSFKLLEHNVKLMSEISNTYLGPRQEVERSVNERISKADNRKKKLLERVERRKALALKSIDSGVQEDITTLAQQSESEGLARDSALELELDPPIHCACGLAFVDLER